MYMQPLGSDHQTLYNNHFIYRTMDQVPASSIASVQLPVTDFSTLADSRIIIVFDDVVRSP